MAGKTSTERAATHPRTPIPLLPSFVAELERAGLRLSLGASGRLRMGPRERITDAARAGLDAHAATVRRLLTLWGSEDGSLVLRTLYHPAPLPAAPFTIRPGVTVTDAARWLERLRTEALDGPSGPRARTGAFQSDLAALAQL